MSWPSAGSSLRYRLWLQRCRVWGRSELALEYATSAGGREGVRLTLESTRQHLGGVRWWARCPGCSRRVVVLWGPPFRCRACHGLQYASAQALKRARPSFAAARVWARLRGPDDRDEWSSSTPRKPRWMRWRTYRRLATRLAEKAVQDAEQQPLRVRGLALLLEEGERLAADTPNELRRRRRRAAAR